MERVSRGGGTACAANSPVRTPEQPSVRGIPRLISVVVPTYDRADLIGEALDSLAAQSWEAIEIVVVDDGSTDGTADLLERWGAAHPAASLRVLRQPNRGAAAARNAGAAAARGEYLYFLDSNDVIAPDALAMLVAPLLDGAAPFSLAHIHNTDLAGRPFGDELEGISRQEPGNYFASRWMTHAALYRRSTFEAVGPFDESLRRAEDTEHQWRVLAVAGMGVLIDRFIGIRRIHSRGHLCIGRTAGEGARDDLAAVRRFLEWAERHGVKSADMCRSAFLRSAIAAVRSGHAGDWDCHAEALSLLHRAQIDRSFARTLAIAVLGRRSRVVHAPFALSLAVLKWFRGRLHAVRRGGRDGAAMRMSGKPISLRLAQEGGLRA